MRNPGNPLIYIIDKSSSYRRIIRACLSAINFNNIRSFESIAKCMAAGGSPDIIILDDLQGREHLSGMEFFRVYRDHYKESCFIFLSSNTSLEVAVEAIKLGAIDYILKSKTGIDRLVRKVDHLVSVNLRIRKRKRTLRAAALSLGMCSLLLAVAVLLYNA